MFDALVRLTAGHGWLDHGTQKAQDHDIRFGRSICPCPLSDCRVNPAIRGRSNVSPDQQNRNHHAFLFSTSAPAPLFTLI